MAGNPDPLFQYHHHPFTYFADVGGDPAARALHLQDETDFVAALQKGTLPNVSWVKPIGADNEHPGYTDVISGEVHVDGLLQQIQASPYWPRRIAAAGTIPRECRVEEEWVDDSVFEGTTARTLFLTGADTVPELAAATRRLARSVPGAQVRVIEGHDHFAHRADPELVCGMIRDFVRA